VEDDARRIALVSVHFAGELPLKHFLPDLIFHRLFILLKSFPA
jgi:hypothetical protein